MYAAREDSTKKQTQHAMKYTHFARVAVVVVASVIDLMIVVFVALL